MRYKEEMFKASWLQELATKPLDTDGELAAGTCLPFDAMCPVQLKNSLQKWLFLKESKVFFVSSCLSRIEIKMNDNDFGRID